MNKLTLNLGLSLIFSTSLLMSPAHASTAKSDDTTAASQSQSVDPDAMIPASQTPNVDPDAMIPGPQTPNVDPDAMIPGPQTPNVDPDDDDAGFDQVVNKPDYSQNGQKQKKDTEEKKSETKIKGSTSVPTTSLAQFLNQVASSSMNEVQTAPSSPAPTPSTPKAAEPPVQAEEGEGSPQVVSPVHNLQGVVMDITASALVVKYKTFSKSASKSKSAAKKSLASAVKAQDRVQIIHLNTERLDPGVLESLEEYLFEECKFAYEIDSEGVRYVTEIR